MKKQDVLNSKIFCEKRFLSRRKLISDARGNVAPACSLIVVKPHVLPLLPNMNGISIAYCKTSEM